MIVGLPAVVVHVHTVVVDVGGGDTADSAAVKPGNPFGRIH